MRSALLAAKIEKVSACAELSKSRAEVAMLREAVPAHQQGHLGGADGEDSDIDGDAVALSRKRQADLEGKVDRLTNQLDQTNREYHSTQANLHATLRQLAEHSPDGQQHDRPI